ncbi:MBL fold metallo-hydrolase [Pseudonocardia benzenivorans]
MSTPRSRAAGMPDPSVQDLGKGFHVFVQLDGSWGLNNVGIFAGRDGVILVDTTFTEGRARALRAAVTELSPHPIRTVLNTHHHGDHTYGNYLFPEATIIGHELCRSATIATGFETKKWFPDVDWGDIRIVPPAVTFRDELTLWCDDVPATVRFVGPAHTTNDVYMWVPEHSLLFAGDLVFNGGTPFVVMGSISGAARARRARRARRAHGRARARGRRRAGGGRPPARLPAVAAGRRAAGFDAGTEPLDLARSVDLGTFARLTDSERLVGNLHRAYSELRGEPLGGPLDYDRIVDEMVAFNDGQPLHCVA